jgi:oxalate decarboxylase/phosphoglucose isomerase-like protein (cupin superfamily)
VREERLRLAGAPTSRLMRSGTTFYVPPTAIHRVMHPGGGPAVTLHAYSPPLARTGAYRLGEGGELERLSMSYEEELRAEALLT